jgi:molybdopterin-guanine dinucleotide biosynthesis protein A
MVTTRINAVVLAGGPAPPELQAALGVTNRAMVPLAGRTMLDYVVDALAKSTSVDGIVVVGDIPVDGRYSLVADQGGMLDNLLAGAAETTGDRVLVATSDIPFLTPAAVDGFVTMALEHDVDFVYPVVEMEAYKKRFAGLKRTTVRLREGEFTGGNIVMLRRSFVTDQSDRIRQAYALRKDVLKLGALLGPELLLRLVASQTVAPSALSIPMLEAGIARLLDAKVAAVITAYPEIGTDVDKAEEIDAAIRILGGATVG